jgi:hypothetical protein
LNLAINAITHGVGVISGVANTTGGDVAGETGKSGRIGTTLGLLGTRDAISRFGRIQIITRSARGTGHLIISDTNASGVRVR